MTPGQGRVLVSLDGDLNAEIGPGALNKIGKVGNLFAKILSITSIQSIFSDRMIGNLSGEGIPFQSIKTQTSFAKGTLNLNNLNFESKAMNANSEASQPYRAGRYLQNFRAICLDPDDLRSGAHA